MMNLSNLKKVSAFAFGIIAGFAIDKYATGDNIAKLKKRASDVYEKLSNKVSSATEPKVDYVEEDAVDVDEDLLNSCEHMILRCKPDCARCLYEHMNLTIKVKGYITINDIVNLGWLSDETINEIAKKYTVDECALFGWANKNDHYYDAGSSAGKNYLLISNPEDLTDIIYEQENDISVDTGSIMDTYMKWNENSDKLPMSIGEVMELSAKSRRDSFTILADLSDKMDEDGFVSIATLMQVIYDVENVSEASRSFKDRFSFMTENYDEDTLINYGWTSFDDFCADSIPDEDGYYSLTKRSPHNITSLVEKWTEKNRKEFEEETKAE